MDYLALGPFGSISERFVQSFAPNLIFILGPEQAYPERKGQFGDNRAVGRFGLINTTDCLLDIRDLGLL